MARFYPHPMGTQHIFSRTTVGPFTKCIYCGKPGTENKLTDEHEIPLSLSGKFLLLKASCADCRDRTSEIERFFARDMYGALRAHLNLKSRTPKKRPKEYVWWTSDASGNPEQRKLPIHEHPQIFGFPVFSAPPRLWTLNPRAPQPGFRIAWTGFPEAVERLKKLEPDKFYLHFDFNPNVFCRVIAKVAHCMAVAYCGLDGFTPILSDFIRGNQDDPFDYVGSLPSDFQIPHADEAHPKRSGRALHKTTVCKQDSSNRVVARIQLFSALGAPEYFVVVGASRAAHITSNSSLTDSA